MLRKFVAIAVFMVIMGACVATVPSFRATKATEPLLLPLGTPTLPIDVGGDIMAVPLLGQPISIRRRGSNGMYNEVSQLNEDANPFTNGEWIAVIVLNDTESQYYLKIYKLDGDAPTNPVLLPIIPTRSLRFFPGNVFVAESSESSPTTLEIYSYTDSWAYRGSVDLNNNHVVLTVFVYLSTDGKFVVTRNETFIDIWEFQNNPPTFNRIESFPCLDSNNNFGLYNGVDTVVAVSASVIDNDVYGLFQVYTKTNGEWSMTQNVTGHQLGLRPTAYLGTNGLFLDQNTFVLNALFENSQVEGSSPTGKSVVMSRGVDGLWTQSMHIEVDPNDDVAFGLNIVRSNYNELLIPGLNPDNSTGYIYSTCLPTPINVTCNDISTPTDCNNLDVTSLYTINSSPACGEVNATVVSSTTTDNQVKVELNFMKIGASTSCISTVTCLTAPVAPIATPIASSTPVKAPTGKVSGGVVMEFAGAVLLAIAITL